MKRKLVIAAVAASVVIGGGAAVALADDGPHDGRARGAAAGPAAAGRSEAAGSSKLTAAEAIGAALRHTPGTAVGAGLEDDGADAGAWHVDVVRTDGSEYTVALSPAGTVTGAHRDAEDDAEDADEAQDDDAADAAEARAERAALKGVEVDAREAALAVTGKGAVTEVDLDADGRAAVWSVETAGGGEWLVDPRTGKVAQDPDA
ncbi:PepSY domain-containing protein [Streptomyces sp. NBC_00704]|uniref:PepSY domain-containing protein n=1 Tax=Streptomyces sp. NBC_00704 TaxID=2975809 RepID=UPI002E2EBABD|nr:PepSY domain-containing protein [Streptomyces sp. NBC_00704]